MSRPLGFAWFLGISGTAALASTQGQPTPQPALVLPESPGQERRAFVTPQIPDARVSKAPEHPDSTTQAPRQAELVEESPRILELFEAIDEEVLVEVLDQLDFTPPAPAAPAPMSTMTQPRQVIAKPADPKVWLPYDQVDLGEESWGRLPKRPGKSWVAGELSEDSVRVELARLWPQMERCLERSWARGGPSQRLLVRNGSEGVREIELRHQGFGDRESLCMQGVLESASFEGEGTLYLELDQRWSGLLRPDF